MSVSGDSWGSQEGCQGPFRPSGRNRGLPLSRRGEGERVLALESREGTRASRRVEEGLSRSLSGGGVLDQHLISHAMIIYSAARS